MYFLIIFFLPFFTWAQNKIVCSFEGRTWECPYTLLSENADCSTSTLVQKWRTALCNPAPPVLPPLQDGNRDAFQDNECEIPGMTHHTSWRTGQCSSAERPRGGVCMGGYRRYCDDTQTRKRFCRNYNVELCNGLDDNCNGLIDEGANCCLPGPEQTVTLPHTCRQPVMQVICPGGVQQEIMGTTSVTGSNAIKVFKDGVSYDLEFVQATTPANERSCVKVMHQGTVKTLRKKP